MTNPNSVSFLFPIIKFKNLLKDNGFLCNIFFSPQENITKCDFLLIESKSMTKNWDENSSLEKICDYSLKTKVIWCDQSDSTGTFLAQIVPHVYKFAKAQILKDRTLYLKKFYADRLYTDYYHKTAGVQDTLEYGYPPVQNPDDLKKICVSWNSGLMNYGYFRPLLMKFFPYAPCATLMQFSKSVAPVNASRAVDVSCRMGISYPRETVCHQRREIRKILHDYIPTEKVSWAKYLHEIANCKICVSPFGYGEITLKDFECFLKGAMLLKPDMDHMETWPNFYEKDVTYAAHNWDLNDVRSTIESLLSDNSKRTEIAQAGQQRYLEYTTAKNAPAHFIRHFSSLVS